MPEHIVPCDELHEFVKRIQREHRVGVNIVREDDQTFRVTYELPDEPPIEIR